MSSIFTKILRGEIPSEIVYETDLVFVIKDINPEDTTHLLIIPKEEIASIKNINHENKEIMGEMFIVANIVAEKMGVSEGFQLKINVGDYQEVPHIHMHLISKR